MADYAAVQRALSEGADPAMLCATCPWDRHCINPPELTRAQVNDQIRQAEIRDARANAAAANRTGEPVARQPIGAVMTALVLGGRDLLGMLCPVFALRLRSSQGRQVADQTKAMMQNWDDQA